MKHLWDILVTANIEFSRQVEADSAEEARGIAQKDLIAGDGDISNITVERCIMLDELSAEERG